MRVTKRGLRLPAWHQVQVDEKAPEELKNHLEELMDALQQWEDVDFQLRSIKTARQYEFTMFMKCKKSPVHGASFLYIMSSSLAHSGVMFRSRRTSPTLNLFTHSNIRDLSGPEPNRTLLAQLGLRPEQVELIRKALLPAETMWDSTLRFVGGLRRFSLLFGLQPMVRREAEALKHVSMALEKVHPLEWRVNVPAYLKQGSPNLFRLEASRVMPSLLQMFQDVQGSMPHASQVLVCFGLPDMCEEEQLRLFLLRCMLSNSLHVLLLPESLSYKAQEYFTSLWRFLVQELQASAGQKKYLLALVVSQRSCLLLDFFRAYQQDPPQLRVDLLRTQIQERCTIVWSQTTCAGLTCAPVCCSF